jgi:hypothetical protein
MIVSIYYLEIHQRDAVQWAFKNCRIMYHFWYNALYVQCT